MKPRRRQQLAYLILVAATVAASIGTYLVVEAKWVAFRFGEQSYRAGDYSQAAGYFEKAVAAGLTTDQAVFRLSDSLIAEGRREQAAQVLKGYLAEHKLDRYAALRLAGVYDSLGQPQQALAVLADRTDLDPTGPAALYRAELMARLGRGDEALALIRQRLAGNPNDRAARLKLIELYTWTGQLDLALEKLEAWLAEHPDDRQLRFRLARVLAAAGKTDQAIRQYQQALGEDS